MRAISTDYMQKSNSEFCSENKRLSFPPWRPHWACSLSSNSKCMTMFMLQLLRKCKFDNDNFNGKQVSNRLYNMVKLSLLYRYKFLRYRKIKNELFCGTPCIFQIDCEISFTSNLRLRERWLFVILIHLAIIIFTRNLLVENEFKMEQRNGTI